ncbi:MAG: GNAT family N-acetyltransferase [Saprospiraceae bacterium]|nr:GNAT family N-acetyltransferase [Saprospiraceae bacterium]
MKPSPDHPAFNSFPVLHTSRLTLRDIQLSDAEEIFGMRANNRVNQFIARPTMEEVTSAANLVEKTRQAYADKKAIGWAGILRDQQKIIGTCGFSNIDWENHRAEIGGEMTTAYWGKQLALEAVAAIVQFGLHSLHLHSIEARVQPGNRGAIALLEHLGFQKEAHLRDRILFVDDYLDMAIYTVLHGDENRELCGPPN